MEMIIKCNNQDIEELFKNKFPDMDKIREDFWKENENRKLKEELQDLKLENDRLKQREEIMLHFIKSCACMYSCKECDITDKQNHCHYLQFSDSNPIGPRMRKTSRELLSRLEDL